MSKPFAAEIWQERILSSLNSHMFTLIQEFYTPDRERFRALNQQLESDLHRIIYDMNQDRDKRELLLQSRQNTHLFFQDKKIYDLPYEEIERITYEMLNQVSILLKYLRETKVVKFQERINEIRSDDKTAKIRKVKQALNSDANKGLQKSSPIGKDIQVIATTLGITPAAAIEKFSLNEKTEKEIKSLLAKILVESLAN